MFVNIVVGPKSGFEKTIKRDCTEEIQHLLKLLGGWDKVRQSLGLEDIESTYMNEGQKNNPGRNLDPSAFGRKGVRTLAEHLHQSLHNHWPCKDPSHIHKDTLGECTEAKLHLDPRWSFQGLPEDSFFLILNGPEINQECKLHLASCSQKYVPDLSTG